MRINKLALFCFALTGLQGCGTSGTNPSPTLPLYNQNTDIPRAQMAIENSEYLDEELAANQAAAGSKNGGGKASR